MGQWLSRKQDRWFQGSRLNGTVAVKKTGWVVSRELGDWDSGCQGKGACWCSTMV